MKKLLWITLTGLVLSTQPLISNDGQKSTSYKDVLVGSIIGAGLCTVAFIARSKGVTIKPSNGAFKTFISDLMPWNRKSKEMKNLESQIKALQEHLQSFDTKTQNLSENIAALQKDSVKQGRRIEQEVAGLKTYTTHRIGEIKTILNDHTTILNEHTKTLENHGQAIDALQETANVINMTGTDTNLKVTRLDNAVKSVLVAFAKYSENTSRRSLWSWSENTIAENNQSEQKKIS